MSESRTNSVAIIGGGPAGLMAAEVLSQAGVAVDLYEAMPSVGRKLLRAGIGGLNLSHAEDEQAFLGRYRGDARVLEPWLQDFGAQQVRDWAAGLGVETFVGSSQRIFPVDMKAAPLLRAWLHRLRQQQVRLHVRHRWCGWSADGRLEFETPQGPLQVRPRAVLLALGGGSWPQLGSDGAWVPLLRAQGVAVAELQPSNCGFEGPGWSPVLQEHAGQPLKNLRLRPNGGTAVAGQCVLTATGLEGGAIYGLSTELRTLIERDGQALLWLDLLPRHDPAALRQILQRPRGKQSVASFLRRQLKLDGAKVALLRELAPASAFRDLPLLAGWIKALPVPLLRPRPLAEAISSAGGVRFEALDGRGMLAQQPGVFCAGEMLDWDAPTGGYLLTACLASGRAAATGILQWLGEPSAED